VAKYQVVTDMIRQVMPKEEGKIRRRDIRVPLELDEQIKAIASASGAKVNHRSGEVEVSPTIIQLLRLGIAYQENLPDIIPDNLSDTAQKLDNLEATVRELSSRLGKLSA
jgi:hypothetical protein